MLAKVYSGAVYGVDAYPVEIEVNAGHGDPAVVIVGLPDAAVKESKDRVWTALINSGFAPPMGRTTINLAPADIKKEGPSFDLPIALGVLAGDLFPKERLADLCVIGELALSGEVRRVRGVLPIALMAKKEGYSSILVPAENAEEARAAQTLDDRSWDNGYQHYEWLFNKDPELLLVAVEKDTNRFLGYVGVERFNESDMVVGFKSGFTKSMPGWNHNPREWHKEDGTVYHITGAAVIHEAWSEGVFDALMNELIKRARENGSIYKVASTYNLRHPSVKDPLKVWGKLGMEALVATYDPRWNHDGEIHPKSKPIDGSIIFAINT